MAKVTITIQDSEPVSDESVAEIAVKVDGNKDAIMDSPAMMWAAVILDIHDRISKGEITPEHFRT